MTARTQGTHPGGPLNLRLRKSKSWYWVAASNLDRKGSTSSLPDVPLSSNTSRASNSKSREQNPYPYLPYSVDIGGAMRQINGYGSNLPEVHLLFKEGKGMYSAEVGVATNFTDSSPSCSGFGAVDRNGFGSNLPDVRISLMEDVEVCSSEIREDLSNQQRVPSSKCLPDSPRNYANYESTYSTQERMGLWAQEDVEAEAALEKHRQRQLHKKSKK